MIYNTLLAVLAVSAGMLDIALGESHGRIWGRSNLSPRQNNETPSTCLAEKAIQTASFSDGQGQNDKGVKAGQAKSETSQNNFIDACDGQTLTNGLQNLDGSCNPIPMGEIPSFENMVSAIILSPENVEDLQPNTAFDIKLQVNNLIAGAFTNPDITYYTAPQRLEGGKIVGHVHVTVQDIGQANPNQPPDPKVFQFFKGIDDAGDNNGGLKASSPGLPKGFYRICTMVSARNHQPVTMPKAQRGAQDDCIRITVGQGKAAGAGNGGQQDAGGDQQADNQQDAGGDQQAAGGDQQAAGGDQQAAAGDQQAAGGDQQAAGGDQQAAGGDQQTDGQQAAGGDQQAAGGDQQAAGGDQQAAGGDQQAAGGDQQAAGGDQQTDGQQAAGGDQQAAGGDQQAAGGDQQAAGGDQQTDGQQDAGTDQGAGGEQGDGQGSTEATITNGNGSAQPTGSTGQQDSAGVNARGNTRGNRGRHQHRGNRGNRGDRGNRRKNFRRASASPLESRGPVNAQQQPKIVPKSYHLI